MNSKSPESSSIDRRQFLQISTAGVGALMGSSGLQAQENDSRNRTTRPAANRKGKRKFNSEYAGPYLNRVAFPLGGIGAGMICLEGSGAISHVSLRHRPEVFHEPMTFGALCIKGDPNMTRVLEGPVPEWKRFGQPGSGNGAHGAAFGLPHFRSATFRARFPFATVALKDEDVPFSVEITGWSPFEPGDADNASLPVAALEYRITNQTLRTREAVFSWSARNFLQLGQNKGAVKECPGGFTLSCAGPIERGWEEGSFTASVDDPRVVVNHAWFRGGWFDPLTMAWRDISDGKCIHHAPLAEGEPSPGATLSVPFTLGPRASKVIVLRFAWFVGQTNLRIGTDRPGASAPAGSYKPFYAARFKNVSEVTQYWADEYYRLRANSQRFSHCFYDSTLPPEVLEAVAANLTILKSPTVLRQADGRLWAWEGCGDGGGCCHGTCTHVWNYAQAIPHLFPSLERTLRETEFGPSQDDRGHQQFRSALPIRPVANDFHAAADGQLGGIMKVHREWRISGDTEWLRRLWPKVKASLDFCIEAWDPAHQGWLVEPHHNTYDIEFWGPDGMCTSFYLGALKAATAMGKALGDGVPLYSELLAKGLSRFETELFDGEYFIQKVQWQNLRAKSPLEIGSMVGSYSPEARALLEQEGPKYQYGKGCLSDGVLGSWMAEVCGLGQIGDRRKIASHLQSVHRYNLKLDLTAHPNPQRPSYACASEGGLLLCTWPKGGALSLPFVYSNEVWTGIEYQVASHLMFMGHVDEGLEIVRVARDRYDGRVRNPFNEYECGHWYARALSSYGLLQGLSGARYDAVTKTLHLTPSLKGDFRCFFAAAQGYGTVGIKNGQAFFEPVAGNLEIREIKTAAA